MTDGVCAEVDQTGAEVAVGASVGNGGVVGCVGGAHAATRHSVMARASIVGRRETMFISLLMELQRAAGKLKARPVIPANAGIQSRGNLDARGGGHDDDDPSADVRFEPRLPATGVLAQSVRRTKETRYLPDTGFLCADGFAMTNDGGDSSIAQSSIAQSEI
jgi:hypothetical protein